MIFRAVISLSFIASNGVVAFAPSSAAPDNTFARVVSTLRLSTTEPSSEEELINGNKPKKNFALLFDCDGVILETEELHRLAYNAAFQEFGVTRICGDVSEPVDWSVGYYDILQNSIGGGKPKMRHYFSQLLRFESNEFGDPTIIEARVPVEEKDAPKKKKKKGKKKKNKQKDGMKVTITAEGISTGLESLIDSLQTRKTELYKTTVEETAVPRPGLLDLMDEALADDSIAVGVCSASTKEAAQKVLECTLGADRVKKLDVCILGDDVSEKKPSPMIYNAARDRLGIDSPSKCVVVEDSAVGLRAAKAAGMRCLITYTSSTTNEDFYGMGADAKVPDLVNGGNPVTLDSIFAPLREAFSVNDDSNDKLPELLIGLKDEAVVVDDDVFDDEDNLISTGSGWTTLEPSKEETSGWITLEPSNEEVSDELEQTAEAVGNLIENDQWEGLTLLLSEVIKIAVVEDIKNNAGEFLGKDNYKLTDIVEEIDAKVNAEIAKMRGNKEYGIEDLVDEMHYMAKDMVQKLTENPYEPSSLSTELDKRVKAAVASFCGKDQYRFGDLSKEIDRRVKNRVADFTGKDEYSFGDISKEIEIRRREWVKEYLGGDAAEKYRFGDITKKAVSNFTGKDEYKFGDITTTLFGKLFGRNKDEESTSEMKEDLEAGKDGNTAAEAKRKAEEEEAARAKAEAEAKKKAEEEAAAKATAEAEAKKKAEEEAAAKAEAEAKKIAEEEAAAKAKAEAEAKKKAEEEAAAKEQTKRRLRVKMTQDDMGNFST